MSLFYGAFPFMMVLNGGLCVSPLCRYNNPFESENVWTERELQKGIQFPHTGFMYSLSLVIQITPLCNRWSFIMIINNAFQFAIIQLDYEM